MLDAALFPGLSWNSVDDVRQMLAYPFMVNALEAGTIVAVMAGVSGWFMTLRRQTFAGHTLAVIEHVGAAGFATGPVGELSGGEQQRLLIAQALARRPRLLLLDEPLDSLDLPNQAAIAALVRRICEEERVAVLLVTHDVNPILGYLDRVVYVAAGTAVAGRPEDVVSSETLSRLYRSPVEVLRASDGRLVVVGQPEAPFVHGHRHDHA